MSKVWLQLWHSPAFCRRAEFRGIASDRREILWSAPAERSGDGAFGLGDVQSSRTAKPKRCRRSLLPAHSKLLPWPFLIFISTCALQLPDFLPRLPPRHVSPTLQQAAPEERLF